jgi:hypothetical protein
MRTRSGRLSRAQVTFARDHGTPEGVRNRAYLVNGSPVELAGSGIGVLLAAGHIDRGQARAADHYAALRAICFGLGRPSVAHDMVEPYDPRPRTDDRLASAREAYEGLAGRLGRDQKAALEVVVVDGRLPDWFWRAKLGRALRPEDESEREAVLSGLTVLATRR